LSFHHWIAVAPNILHEASVFRKRFSCQKLKILMWEVDRSTHPTVWERVMLTIKDEEISLIAKFLLN